MVVLFRDLNQQLQTLSLPQKNLLVFRKAILGHISLVIGIVTTAILGIVSDFNRIGLSRNWWQFLSALEDLNDDWDLKSYLEIIQVLIITLGIPFIRLEQNTTKVYSLIFLNNNSKVCKTDLPSRVDYWNELIW